MSSSNPNDVPTRTIQEEADSFLDQILKGYPKLYEAIGSTRNLLQNLGVIDDDENPLTSAIERATGQIDDRSQDIKDERSEVLGDFPDINRAFGTETKDAMAYYKDFFTATRNALMDPDSGYFQLVNNFSPNFQNYRDTNYQSYTDDIEGRSLARNYGPIASAADNIIGTTDPARVYGALNFGVQGYNENNPLINYDKYANTAINTYQDPDSQEMIKLAGDRALNMFGGAMTNPGGVGRQLMSYNY